MGENEPDREVDSNWADGPLAEVGLSFSLSKPLLSQKALTVSVVVAPTLSATLVKSVQSYLFPWICMPLLLIHTLLSFPCLAPSASFGKQMHIYVPASFKPSTTFSLAFCRLD